jgi:hypothetical protein
MLATYLHVPHLPSLIRRFLYEQENPDPDVPLDSVLLEDCPRFRGTVRVYPSACAIYYAPSDKSGTRSMFRERIRAVDSWRGGPLAEIVCLLITVLTLTDFRAF